MAISSISLLDSASENIYPNSVDGKYFTATQARIYVGNLFLDELVSIQYTDQRNQIPVYGYSSKRFDALGSGKGLVQGQLALNFVTKGYLYTVLDEFNTLNAKGIPSAIAANASLMATAVQQSKALAGQIAQSTTAAQGDTLRAQKAQSDAQIVNLAQTLGPTGIDLYTSSLSASSANLTAVDLEIPFDIQFQYAGAGRTITKTIQSCKLISNDQVLDQSGSVLLDAYGFIGRQIV